MKKVSLPKNPYVYAIIAAVALIILYNLSLPKPVKRLDIYNTTFFFRADINKAAGIKVYPSEEQLYSLLNNDNVSKITIFFDPNQSAIATLESYEITYKLKYHYLVTQNKKVEFEGKQIAEFDDNATEQNIYIYLNKTSRTDIRIVNNTIYLNYTDKDAADLVVIKLILVAFGLFS